MDFQSASDSNAVPCYSERDTMHAWDIEYAPNAQIMCLATVRLNSSMNSVHFNEKMPSMRYDVMYYVDCVFYIAGHRLKLLWGRPQASLPPPGQRGGELPPVPGLPNGESLVFQ